MESWARHFPQERGALQAYVDALYAFTDCEQSISCNLLVIQDNLPVQTSVTEVIKTHAKQLTTSPILGCAMPWPT